MSVLAAAKDGPRRYRIDAAIINYIELHAYQDALVLKGLEEMRSGQLIRHEEVVNRVKKRDAGVNDGMIGTRARIEFPIWLPP